MSAGARPRGRAAPAALVLAWCAAGCDGRGLPDATPHPATEAGLVAALAEVRGAAGPAAGLAAWRLAPAELGRVLVEPFGALAGAYQAGFRDAALDVARVLARPGPLRVRRHFAGDPRLTAEELHLRWAVPPLYPSFVAEVDGVEAGAVFVHAGTGWRLLAGVEDALAARVTPPGCAARLARATGGRCAEVGWMIADRALRGDLAGLRRACDLAVIPCGR